MMQIVTQSIEIAAPNDWTLAGTLFESALPPKSKEARLLMISSAAGVPMQFYRSFAEYLIEQGARAVVSYDYRGIAMSSGDKNRWKELRMKDWALLDFPAVAGWLTAKFPGHDLVGVGHSYGGQALGLSGISDSFIRYGTVATMSGYWADLDQPYSVWLRTQVLGRMAVKLFGHVPKSFSPGEAMPGNIFLDWCRWIANPLYFFDDPDLPETARFADVTLPYLSIGLTDDPWGTRKAVGTFMAHYTTADLQQIWLEPNESGPIGHLGFFRKQHRETHWPAFKNFLLEGVLPETAENTQA